MTNSMQEMEQFLRSGLIPVLRKLEAAQPALWGKMNAQQMVEHLLDFIRVSTHKLQFPLVSPPEHLPKLMEFLYSDKQFRENTKAPISVLGEEPLPLRYPSFEEAVQKLSEELSHFFQRNANEPELRVLHPVFGELNYEEWIRLHYKHVTHHLRQFGLM
jgi:hypothetical protein